MRYYIIQSVATGAIWIDTQGQVLPGEVLLASGRSEVLLLRKYPQARKPEVVA